MTFLWCLWACEEVPEPAASPPPPAQTKSDAAAVAPPLALGAVGVAQYISNGQQREIAGCAPSGWYYASDIAEWGRGARRELKIRVQEVETQSASECRLPAFGKEGVLLGGAGIVFAAVRLSDRALQKGELSGVPTRYIDHWPNHPNSERRDDMPKVSPPVEGRRVALFCWPKGDAWPGVANNGVEDAGASLIGNSCELWLVNWDGKADPRFKDGAYLLGDARTISDDVQAGAIPPEWGNPSARRFVLEDFLSPQTPTAVTEAEVPATVMGTGATPAVLERCTDEEIRTRVPYLDQRRRDWAAHLDLPSDYGDCDTLTEMRKRRCRVLERGLSDAVRQMANCRYDGAGPR